MHPLVHRVYTRPNLDVSLSVAGCALRLSRCSHALLAFRKYGKQPQIASPVDWQLEHHACRLKSKDLKRRRRFIEWRWKTSRKRVNFHTYQFHPRYSQERRVTVNLPSSVGSSVDRVPSLASTSFVARTLEKPVTGRSNGSDTSGRV